MAEAHVVTETALQLLNTLQQQDPEACADLMAHRTPVVPAIGDHPDFICHTARGGKVQLGFLGLINSLLVKLNEPKLAAVIDDDGVVIGFTQRNDEKVQAKAPAAPAQP